MHTSACDVHACRNICHVHSAVKLPWPHSKLAADHAAEVLLQEFRATGGKALVWGAKPRKITAHYTTADGTPKTSLLLASGGFCLRYLRSRNTCGCKNVLCNVWLGT